MRKFLFIASVAALSLFGCKNNGGGNATTSATDSSAVNRVVSSQVAYINMDTLMRNYDMFLDLSSALEEKAKKADSELNAKGRSLEKSLADAQEKVDRGLVTRAQAAQLQEDLQKQQESFLQHRDKVQGELAEENQVMMNRIYYSIEKYLQEFNSDYRYGMILSTSGGSPVLNADPALDITAIIVKGLNEQYAKEKGQAAK